MTLPITFPSITPINVLDICVFAFAVYVMLAIAIRQGSRRGLAVIGLLAGIYLVAMRWQMPLSLTVFRIGFSAMIVSMAIVYQDDVRAAAERIGRWILGTRNVVVPEAQRISDVLVQSLFVLGEKKQGALVVLQGRDPLDRLLDGGIELDAVVSAPLIYSLFDPSSAGHDGAVVMRAGRIARFATHLPLARSGRAEEYGTRHHAAVGLSECCDAIVLVVSEERGIVSIARQGELIEVEGPGKLSAELHAFNVYRKTRERAVSFGTLFQENIGLKLASIAISLVCWWFVAPGSDDIYRTFLVPVEYRNVPEDAKLSNTLTQEVKVTLAGSENAFKFLAPSALVVSMNAEELARGKRTFTITPKSIRHPANLRVTAIEPRSLKVPVVSK